MTKLFILAALSGAASVLGQSSSASSTSSTRSSSAASPSTSTSTSAGGSGLNATARLAGTYGVSGLINFRAEPGSEVVLVTLSVEGLQTNGNDTTQFPYHIHTNPVPSSGDCKGTLGHLDPLGLTDATVCDPAAPQYCQEGDLSGKHGFLNTSSRSVTFTDPYLRFFPQPLSILGRAVVIHLPNLTRIACGNITSFLDGTADESGAPTNKSSTYVTNYAAAAAPAPSGKATVTLSGSVGLANGTTLPALPAVTEEANVALSTGSSGPTVVAVSSAFSYSSGEGASAFPTQSESKFPSASSSASGSASASAPSSSASNSAAGKIELVGGGLVVGFLGAVAAVLAL